MITEKDLPIVGTIKRSDINGDIPEGAEYAQLSLTDFIQKFYMFKATQWNDGTVTNALSYYGEQGGWHGSDFNTNKKALQGARFLKIEG